MRKFFGTDGIRGRANAEPLTVERALRFGQAVVGVLGNSGGDSPRRLRIVVGRDTRRSCDLLEAAVVAGICSMGADALLAGVLPTPAVAFLTSQLNANAGIMISASHNRFEDNGLKLFDAGGFKLADAQEEEIESIMNSAADELRPTGSAVGVAPRVNDASSRYLTRLRETVAGRESLADFRIVLDCANGAAHEVAPAALRSLGITVHTLGVEPNGENINADCGAMHPAALQQRVLSQAAHLGIALDGDADRLLLVDERGSIVDGDEVLAMLALKLHAGGDLTGNAVVGTVMSNLGLELALRKIGVDLHRTAVGDRYVVEALRKNNWVLGGEPSGHIVFLRHASTGDGLLAALLVLDLMAERKSTLSDLRQVMTRLPQTLVNVRVRRREDLDSFDPVRNTVQRVTAALAGRGRVLVRYSGTEPLVRVMVEGEDAQRIERDAREIAAVIEKELGGS